MSRRAFLKRRGVNGLPWQLTLHIILWITVLLVLAPLLITLLFSVKSAADFNGGLWALPSGLYLESYRVGMQIVNVNMINSIAVSFAAAVSAVFIASLAAYAFARFDFTFKGVLFSLIVALMMVPGVLTLTPQYLNIVRLGLINSRLAVLLPGISGNLVGCIFLFRTFMSGHPDELYESARIDGAGELRIYFLIALPLSLPVLMIQLVGIFAGQYNDYLWPMLVIQRQETQMLMPLLKDLIANVAQRTQNPGAQYAVYLVSGLPLVVTSAIGLKYFVNGDFASGLKF
jgi:ABC-type glycerol-3-phosphate transport system permease component